MNEITGQTRVLGIIGHPLTYTLSPNMHNAAIEAASLDYRYLPFVVAPERLASAIAGIRALGIEGVNVTMPHKETVIEFLDEISPEARTIGAVNTVHNVDGRLKGYNTDGAGFIKSLREALVYPEGRHAIIIGAGGAARAVAAALISEGAASITLLGRTADKVEALKQQLLDSFGRFSIKTLSFDDDLADIFEVGDLVVNTTPIGMNESADLLPVPLEYIDSRHFIYDLIYTPSETALIKAAKEKGAKAVNGLGMLLYQAAAAFEIWTGTPAPIAIMRDALLIGLESGDRPKNAQKKDKRFSS
ncbi:MAG: shikimate dehydrogenase [Actinobacteria bacterium]|nr:shikimate dehydrogenase [Actinomycetota bacterium]